jgi:hypothetical protein
MAIDTSVYERQRRGIEDDYSTKAATNAYSRFLSQQRGERNIADYSRDFKRQAPKLTAAYGRRGMTGGGVQSGVYGNAMRNYVGDYQQQTSRAYADQTQELRSYDLSGAQLTAARDRALSDMETDKAKEIANAASYLAALKPQFGG